MENEIWKDVKGYEGYYQVSNMGRVKSMRVLKTPKNGKICRKNVFLSTKASHDKQYITVALCRDGEKKPIQVHRLVAEAFVPNPNSLPFVNHKDENPSNNCADNLEWCTHEYNLQYSMERNKPYKTKRERPKNELLPLCAYTLSGEFVGRFDSVWDAIEKLGIESKTPRCVRSNCAVRGKLKARLVTHGVMMMEKNIHNMIPQHKPQKSKTASFSGSAFLQALMKLLRENSATIHSMSDIKVRTNGKVFDFGQVVSANEISKMIDAK